MGTDAATAVNSTPGLNDWWRLNPEYEYFLLSEKDCVSLVRQAAPLWWQWAYESQITGAQRSDLVRMLLLYHFGGVYVDSDTIPRRPLRTVIPAEASLVMPPRISFELLISEPRHPMIGMVTVAFAMAAGREAINVRNDCPVCREAKPHLPRNTSHCSCRDSRTCVLVTGPDLFSELWAGASMSSGCEFHSTYPRFRGCERATKGLPQQLSALRQTQSCADENVSVVDYKGNLRGWDCGIARHRHCGMLGVPCSPSHYTQRTAWFHKMPEKPPRAASSYATRTWPSPHWPLGDSLPYGECEKEFMADLKAVGR